MSKTDWIDNEIKKLEERGETLPGAAIDLLTDQLRTELYKDNLKPTEQTQLAKALLTTLQTNEEVADANK